MIDLTGATGYIASHIVKAYLDAGFTVIGTVRRAAGGEYLTRLYNERFSFVVVEDLTAPDALTPFMHRIDLLVHTTNPTHFPDRPYDPQLMIDPSVQATVNVLNSAIAPGYVTIIHLCEAYHNCRVSRSKVQRVVITGSIASITNIGGHHGPYEFAATDWNDWALREVETYGSAASDYTIYSAGKLLSERATNDFVSLKQPSFDVVHVLPYFVYGPVIHDVSGLPNMAVLVSDVVAGSKHRCPHWDSEATMGLLQAPGESFSCGICFWLCRRP